ncbi:hypothetical protein CF70_034460 [Cupriavidus sp. SK-3]|nr:hypothetical protein CF70_034460 [Cupriavidus sp. SK-3]
MLLGAIAAAVSAVGVVMSTVREWGEMESNTLDAVGENMSRWYGTISRIRATYSREQILFAQGYVSDVAVQARARLALFVGALEKVGIIPLVASVALTLANFFKSGSMPLLWFTAAVVAGVFYVLALRLVDIAFTLERFALILRHAIAEKDGR